MTGYFHLCQFDEKITANINALYLGAGMMVLKYKLAMDVWYVDNQTFLLDLKILWRRLLVVIRLDRIN